MVRGSLVAAVMVLLPASLLLSRAQSQPGPSAIHREQGLVFGKGGETELKLDLAMPAEGEGPFPALVCIHGGGWTAGDRGQMHTTMDVLAKHGFVAVSPDYRLAPRERFPAAIEDCKAAVRWLRANAERYHVDPSHIGVFGYSAGGHLACLLGVTGKDDGLEGQGGNAEQSSAVQAVVSFFGPTDLTQPVWNDDLRKEQLEPFLGGTATEKADVYRKASPITYVHKDAPPFLFVHGTQDKIVPIEQSRKMTEKLRQAGVRARLVALEDEGNGHLWSDESRKLGFAHMMNFFDENLKK